MATPLPEKYSWLQNEGAPKILLEALRHYGTLEHPGKGSNPNILEWAKEVGVLGWYTDDSIPWCGLFMGVVIKRCGYELPDGPLGARNWLKFGVSVPNDQAMLWDIMIFTRTGGNHVAFYVGETSTHFLIYGGNQSNSVGFAWIEKTRLLGVRRCKWKVSQPVNIRKIYFTEDRSGKLLNTPAPASPAVDAPIKRKFNLFVGESTADVEVIVTHTSQQKADVEFDPAGNNLTITLK